MRTWIQSLEDKRLELLDLKPDMVGSIESIAHALAGNFRFTRQSRARYSVAEHCVRGAELLPPAFAGAFLLHELSEVYLPDIASPLKPFVRVYVDREPVEGCVLKDLIEWRDLERQHTHVMLEALGLSSIEPLIYCAEIKTMDRRMLVAEKRDLLGPAPEPWSEDEQKIEPATVKRIEPWAPDTAATAFLCTFVRLFK